MSATEQPVPLSRGDRIRVLHVDDDADFLDLSATYLERDNPGFEVVTETDPSDALDRLGEAHIDCVVSDYQMPAMDGLALLDAVREEFPDLPFILYTGKGSEEIASDAISAGVTDYLQKRTGTDQYEILANRVENAVTRYRTAREHERVHAALETATEGIAVLDAAGEYVYLNETYAALYGREREDLVGEHWETLYPAEETERFREEILPALAEEGEWTGRSRGRRDDGTTFVERLSLTDLADGGHVCVVRDISDRVERERQLQRERDRASALFENMAEPIAYYEFENGEPYVEDVNSAFEEMFGVTARKARGRVLDDLIVPPTYIEEGEQINEQVRAGGIVDTEVDRLAADGVRTFNLLSVPLRPGESGERGFAVYTDITERTERERQFQRERERYRSLFENNPLVIWEEDFSGAMDRLEELDAEYDDLETHLAEHPAEIDRLMNDIEVIDVNRNALAYYDAPSKDALIERLPDLFLEETYGMLAGMWAAFADGETRFRGESVARTLSGERRHELLDVFVPEAYADDYSRVFVTGTDITERTRQERELKRKNERLEEFTSVVSHDLRNPLHLASASLELAREECDSDHLAKVANAHERMASLIEDLLTLAREGETVADVQQVDLETVLGECWDILDADRATLEVRADAVVSADPDRLGQLLENLLDNALEHGGEEVTVTVGDTEGGFYVADDGPGVPAEERESVFETGYSRAADGTGFGLSIVDRIAEAHGWSVRVTESADGGARFEITGVEAWGSS